MSRPLASVGDRILAQILDSMIAFAIGLFFYYSAEALGGPLELGFGSLLLYLLGCDGLRGGQSLGKRMAKIAVVHFKTGQPCTYWQSVLRNLSLLIFSFIELALMDSKSRRRLGDYLAGTKVIRTKQ